MLRNTLSALSFIGGLVCLLGLGLPLLHADEQPANPSPTTIAWLDDFETARALAKKEGKDLFVNFTGSDWCGFCWKIRDEVFVKPEFIDGTQERFVFVELDFPRNKQLAPEIKKQNDALKKQHNVRGYPSVLLMTPEGEVFGEIVGYIAGGPIPYLKMVSQYQDNHRSAVKTIAEAETAKGLDRAKLLDKVLDLYGFARIKPAKADEWIKEIKAADTDGQAGLRGKYEMFDELAKLKQLAQTKEGKKLDPDALLKAAEEFFAKYKPTGQPLQDALWYKSRAYYIKKDLQATIRLYQEALDAAPEGRYSKHLTREIERMKKTNQVEPSKD